MKGLSTEVKSALITGFFAIIAAIIGLYPYLFNNERIKNTSKTILHSNKNNDKYLYYATIKDPDGFTYVRRKPSIKGEIIDTVFINQNFKVLDNSLNWYLIKTPKNTIGYMYYNRIKRIR